MTYNNHISNAAHTRPTTTTTTTATIRPPASTPGRIPLLTTASCTNRTFVDTTANPEPVLCLTDITAMRKKYLSSESNFSSSLNNYINDRKDQHHKLPHPFGKFQGGVIFSDENHPHYFPTQLDRLKVHLEDQDKNNDIIDFFHEDTDSEYGKAK